VSGTASTRPTQTPTGSQSRSVSSTASPSASAPYVKPVPFTPGNLVALRLGDGSSSVTTTAMNYAYLDEITPAGTFVQSVMLGATNNVGLQVTNGFGIPGQVATTDTTGLNHGKLFRSADGLFLHVAGYNAHKGTTSVTSAVPRILLRVGNDPLTQTGHWDPTTTRPTTTSNTYWGHFGDNAGTKAIWALASTTVASSGRLEYWNWGSAQTTVPTTTISFAGVTAATYFGSTIYVGRSTDVCTMTNTGTTMNTGLTTATVCTAIAATASTSNIRAIVVVSASPLELWIASNGVGPVKVTTGKTTITCSAVACTDIIGMTLSDDRTKLYFTTRTGVYSVTTGTTNTVANSGAPIYTLSGVNREFRGIALAPVRNGISPSTAKLAPTSVIASYIEDVTKTTAAQRMWLAEYSQSGVLLSNRYVVPGTEPSIVSLYPGQHNHGALTLSKDGVALVMVASGAPIGSAPVAQGTTHGKGVARMLCTGVTSFGPTWYDVNIVTGATTDVGSGTGVAYITSHSGIHYFSSTLGGTATYNHISMSFTKPQYVWSTGTTYPLYAFRRLAAGSHQYWATPPTTSTAPTGSTGATGVATAANLGGSFVIYPSTGNRYIAWAESGVGVRMRTVAAPGTFSTVVPTATAPSGDTALVDVTIHPNTTTVYAAGTNGIYNVPFGGTSWTTVAYPPAPGLNNFRGVSMAPTGC
jgi:hypothetical protein